MKIPNFLKKATNFIFKGKTSPFENASPVFEGAKHQSVSALVDAYALTGGLDSFKDPGHSPRDWGMSRACARIVRKRKFRDARAAG